MPRSWLARNQRLRGNRQTKPAGEVTPLCNRGGAGVQRKESMRTIQRTGVPRDQSLSALLDPSCLLTEN